MLGHAKSILKNYGGDKVFQPWFKRLQENKEFEITNTEEVTKEVEVRYNKPEIDFEWNPHELSGYAYTPEAIFASTLRGQEQITFNNLTKDKDSRTKKYYDQCMKYRQNQLFYGRYKSSCTKYQKAQANQKSKIDKIAASYSGKITGMTKSI